MMNDTSYTKLDVWTKSMDLVVTLYDITKSFPKEAVYALTSQIRRAVTSIPANIAEGRSKRSTREFMRYINMATGSTAELDTHIRIAERLHYLSPEQTSPLLEETAVVGRMLNKLHSSLETKLAGNAPQPLTSSFQSLE
jgi:four helix bundle protein